MTSARLLRYASFLAGFNFDVSFRKGINNQNVDCLSRASLEQDGVSSDKLINEEVDQVCSSTVFGMSTEMLTSEKIIQEADKDMELSAIKKELQETSVESDYVLSGQILFRNDRVVIPKSLQSEVLNELHATHLGIVKMKQLARRYCTWKNIDRDIERMVRSCEECASIRHNPAKAPLHHWDPPSNNWDRVHIDYAGPFQGFYFLVLIDAKSRWAEIQVQRDAPSSANTIRLLNEIFVTHGYPVVMVSDNASIFTSEMFSNYCQMNGIRQKFIAPGQPSTNGLAERNVQTLKNRLKSMAKENMPIRQKVQKILLRYRATPLANGKSPAEMYLNRQIRIKLDAIRPHQEEKSQQADQPHTRFLNVGDKIQARFFINNKHVWKFGTVFQRLGKLHYIIQLDEGRSLKRHIDQLRKSGVPRKTVTFELPPDDAEPVAERTLGYDPLRCEIPGNSSEQEECPDPDPLLSSPSQRSSPLPPAHFSSPPSQQLRRSERPRRAPGYLRDYVVD